MNLKVKMRMYFYNIFLNPMMFNFKTTINDVILLFKIAITYITQKRNNQVDDMNTHFHCM